jgi:hypothetical protein
MERPELFQMARTYFRHLAKGLGSPAYILYRDNGCLSWDWIHEGKSFDEIESEFVKWGSTRAVDLEALRESGPKKQATSYYREDLIQGGR